MFCIDLLKLLIANIEMFLERLEYTQYSSKEKTINYTKEYLHFM